MPTVAFADGAAIYVSSSGDDNNDGTETKPYATLAKAVDAAPSGATIYVMSDLTMSKCARYYNKNLTITSLGENAFKVTRGDVFDKLSDNARSWYNPAMIEVQGNPEGAECGLTLENIILDDGGKHEGTVFAQAISGDGNDNNTVYVQDAIIASNATVPCTITLGEGAVLRNFGGMSAVRVTDQAKLVMESGSKIEDTMVTDRVKGDSGSVGPAGAIWVQNASVEMKADSEISNVIGRAVYADGGKVSIGGKIINIQADEDMWENSNGTVLHLRNSAIAEFSGIAENCSGGVLVITDKATFDMKQGALLGNSDAAGVKTNEDPEWSKVDKADYGIDRNIITINGEITGIQNSKNPIQFKFGTLTIGESGSIHDNAVNYGALYIQRDAVVHIYGKIKDNVSSGRGGGIGTPGHGFVKINMYRGAEIKNNAAASTGGGASLKNCKFTMYGGEISGNTGKTGGGIYLYSDASADILGGTITNNTSEIGPNDLAVTSSNWGTDSIYLYISDEAQIGNPAVYMEQNTKTVSPGDRNIKLHNASAKSVKDLTDASTGKGWSDPLATFWTQRDNAATMTVGGLTINPNNPIVYALMYKTDEAGSHTGELVVCTTTVEGNNVTLTVPGSKNGFAVALVQPTKDFGNVVITGPAEINEDPAAYEIPYKATYTMSRSFISTLKTLAQNLAGDNGTGIELKFVVQLDNRLTAKKDANGKFIYTFNGAGVLETDENGIEVSADEHTITVPCKLKDGWKDAIKDNIVMTLDGTGVLQANDFTSGGVLGTTGNIQAILPIQGEIINVLIPANVCQTKMVGSTPTPPPSADPSPTPGGGNGGGYHYPTTTPVPVIVIPPKTGDMTVWQSILNFLGIK